MDLEDSVALGERPVARARRTLSGLEMKSGIMLADDAIDRLLHTSLQIRRDIVEMLYRAGSGHPGGSLSIVEILTVLYFEAMRVRPESPQWPERDRLILSKGHAAPALYVTLARKGFIPREELWTFNAPGTRLQKHIEMQLVPGTEVSTGSLGQGLSVGVGMALADRMDGRKRRVYIVVGDGESQEGQIWEAAMTAAHYKLDGIIAYLDLNGCQCCGYVDDICSLGSITDKWSSFGWHTQRINGHDVREIHEATIVAQRFPGAPHMIIADTIKGQGVSYMENRPEWHSRAIEKSEYEVALAELAGVEHVLRGVNA